MITASLYNYQRKHYDRPLDLIIDEIKHQNFSNWSPLRKILKNGRKIHMAFIGATQEFYSKGNNIGDAMSKADIKIFFKPISETINEVAEALHISKAEMRHTNKFMSMERGDCFIKSPFYNKKLKRNVSDTIISGNLYIFIEKKKHNSSSNISSVKGEETDVNSTNELLNDLEKIFNHYL